MNLKKTRKIRKFRKTRFNYNKFVKDFYLENNNAYISVKVNNIHDIISKYSIEYYEWLNEEFASYIEENAYYIPIEYDIILEITGHKFTEYEKEIIVETIKTYFGLKVGDTELDLNLFKRKMLYLLFGCIVSMLLLVLLSSIIENFTFLEPAFVIFWFFAEEFIADIFIERTELLNKKTDRGQLSNMQIYFNEDEYEKNSK